MLVERAISWAETVLGVYALLLAIYFATCLAVTALNRRLAAAKIQARETAPALVRRDRRQSLLSLAGIAAMLIVQFTTAGAGWGPLTPALGGLLAATGAWVICLAVGLSANARQSVSARY